MNIHEEIRKKDSIIRIWSIKDSDMKFYVTYITEEVSMRFMFKIHSESPTKECVLERTIEPIPPSDVIEAVNEFGYTITNVPSIQEDNVIDQIDNIISTIEWLKDKGDIDTNYIHEFAYDRTNNALGTAMINILFFESVGKSRYETLLNKTIKKSNSLGHKVTKQEILDPRTHSIEYLQRLMLNMRNNMSLEEEIKMNELSKKHSFEPSGEGKHTFEKDGLYEEQETNESSFDISSEAIEILKEDGWDIKF